MSAPAPAPLPAWFLIGPTGSGKSGLARTLAPRLDAEVLCLDSMQVYAGIPVVTAQPSAEDLESRTHHLYGQVPVDRVFDTARYLELARQAAAGVLARGKQLLFVGGTGLYYNALVDGLAALPPRTPEVRAAIQAELAAPGGHAALRAELSRVDPESAARIDEPDLRRLERAIEVHRVSGRAMSAWLADPVRPAFTSRATLGLRWQREELVERLEARVERMFQQGLEAEMRRLVARTEPLGTAVQAMGVGHFERFFAGQIDGTELRRLLLQDHRRLVRRQGTWFRKRPEVRWLDLSAPLPVDLADRAEALLRGPPPAPGPGAVPPAG